MKTKNYTHRILMKSSRENLYPEIGGFQPNSADLCLRPDTSHDVWCEKFVRGHMLKHMI